MLLPELPFSDNIPIFSLCVNFPYLSVKTPQFLGNNSRGIVTSIFGQNYDLFGVKGCPN